MGLGHEGLRRVAVQGGQGDLEFGGEAVAGAVGERRRGGSWRRRRSPSGRPFLAAHQAQGGVEAGGVAGGEELLGVGAFAAAAEFHRAGQGRPRACRPWCGRCRRGLRRRPGPRRCRGSSWGSVCWEIDCRWQYAGSCASRFDAGRVSGRACRAAVSRPRVSRSWSSSAAESPAASASRCGMRGGLGAERSAGVGQEDLHPALVLAGPAPFHEAQRLEPLEQRGERAGVEAQLLPQFPDAARLGLPRAPA